VSRPRSRERGVALLLVLWIFMLLGVLALDFAQYIRDDAMAAVNFADETRGYYVALAGMNRAISEILHAQQNRTNPNGAVNPQLQQPATLDVDDDEEERLVPADGEWHEGDFAGARWRVRIIDEMGRIPLNSLLPVTAEKNAFLHYVVENLVRGGNRTKGVDRRMEKSIDTITDSIFDWCDADDDARLNGAETDFYAKQRVPYGAKNEQIEAIEELLKIHGVTPDLFYGDDQTPGFRDVFSIARRRADGARVNVRHATREVLFALIGDADAVDNVVTTRDAGGPIVDMVAGLMIANSGGTLGDVKTQFLDEYDEPREALIEARADVKNQRNQARIATLVHLDNQVLIERWWDRAPWDAKLPGAPTVAAEDGA
jgi:general secretion pathway protein K